MRGDPSQMSHSAEFAQYANDGNEDRDSPTILTIRITLNSENALGPGKIRLMELIMESGSISAASRAMGMSYRRAWMLAHTLNNTFREAVILKKVGGSHGGGAELTDLGRDVVARYRKIECLSNEVAATELEFLHSAARTALPKAK